MNGLKHGKGEETFPDGRKYTGNFANDEYDGIGIFVWADGSEYEGSWKAGQWHGVGNYSTAEGETRRGEWSQGQNVRWFDGKPTQIDDLD